MGVLAACRLGRIRRGLYWNVGAQPLATLFFHPAGRRSTTDEHRHVESGMFHPHRHLGSSVSKSCSSVSRFRPFRVFAVVSFRSGLVFPSIGSSFSLLCFSVSLRLCGESGLSPIRQSFRFLPTSQPE